MTDNTIVERLKKIDSCALSDALDRLGLKGQATTLQQHSGDVRIAGRAVTVRLDNGPPPEGPPRHLCTTAIELSGPENVIIVEQRTGLEAGCWGGLLTRGALQRGVAGVVADGPVRDIDEARSLGFPIFTNKLTCFTARGRVVERETNGKVSIGGVCVSPGDYVVADRSAVIFISEDNVEKVLEAAEMIVKREAAMVRAIEDNRPISKVLGGDYEDMLKG